MIPTEAQEQKDLFRWAELMSKRYPELELLFHIPNGGSRHIVEAANLKAQGVRAGVPDIFLPVARLGYHGMFIEMKRRKGGRLSEAQKEWICVLERNGYFAIVCAGWEEAVEAIESYLKK